MEREQIMAVIEKIQRETEHKGFKGQNEHDLYLREALADFIIEKEEPNSKLLKSYLQD